MQTQLEQIIFDIDEVNSFDPNKTNLDGTAVPDELLYGQRMSAELDQFNPNAPELLKIAVRAQHIERWILAREDFPEGRSGYKKWRSQLALHHANRTGELMLKRGYSDSEVERVKYLLLKRGLKRDEDTQCLEDVACIVFLKYYFSEFASKHPKPKLINILQLTWGKMSDSGHEAALKLDFAPAEEALIKEALS